MFFSHNIVFCTIMIVIEANFQSMLHIVSRILSQIINSPSASFNTDTFLSVIHINYLFKVNYSTVFHFVLPQYFVTTTFIYFQNICITPKLNLYLLSSYFLPPPPFFSLWYPLPYFLFLWTYLFWIFNINGII